MSNSLRQRPPSATSSAPVGHAGTSTSGGGSTSTRTSVNVSREALADAIHDPAPRLEPYHRLFGALLFLTVITGTLISIVTYGTAVTSFRGRLPSPSSKIAFHSSYLPGALSSLPLPNLLPNYFANKRNIFNVVFVKRAWGWTTLAWGLHWLAGIFAAQQQSAGGALNTSRSTRKRLVYRPLKRYALATVYWLLFTTWFFGPSISDRLLVLSGAQCVPSSLSSADASAAPPAAAGAQTANEPNHVILDHSHCTFGSSVLRAGSVEAGDDAAKGASSASGLSGKLEAPGAAQHRGKHGRKAYWKGGHDISGHSFLLTLSSLFLATEIAPTLSVLANGVHSGLTAATGAVAGSSRTTSTGPASRIKLESLPLRKYTALATVALISLWWWMLLMTSLYFHTPQEKISGFAAGVIAWWSSYALAG